MSRQSQTSTFNDGLNKDFNPVLTPNTVMSDCLNGTIVTYNGNEFALQNDMGNYKFTHGSLNDGYVPIGIKEHANVLYIVSYNPIEDKVEIGSFPSMKTVSKSNLKNSENKNFGIDLGSEQFQYYTELSSNSNIVMLSEITDDFKLNPGDAYIITGEDTGIINNWKHTSIYVLTENNKLYDITSFVELSNNSNVIQSSDFKNVKWDVSGWIAMKESINVMNEFNCYIQDIAFSAKKDKIVSNVIINIQSIWDSKIYSSIKNELSNSLFYIVYGNSGESEDLSEILKINYENCSCENKTKSYNNIYDVIHSSIVLEDCECSNIKIIPALKISDSQYVVYDQFATDIILERKDWNNGDVKIAENIFKYNSDNDSLTLSFDLICPIGSKMKYQLVNRNNDPIFSEPKDFDDIIYGGQNIIDIEYTTNDNKQNFINDFNKEDFYKLYIYVYSDVVQDLDKADNDMVTKFEADLYVSEFNNYYHGLYDHFKSDEFVLDEDAFIEAMHRNLKLVESINSEDVSKYNTLDEFKSEFINIPYWLSDKSNIKQEYNVQSGTKYNFSKNINIDWPKDQWGNTGRFWNGLFATNVSVKVLDSNNSYVDTDDAENSFSINISNNVNVSINNNKVVNKLYPESPHCYKNFYDSDSIEKLEDGWYKINYLHYFVKGYYKKVYRWGKIFTEYPLKFKVVNNMIILKHEVPNDYGGSVMTAEYVGGNWVYTGLYDPIFGTTFFDQIFDQKNLNSNEDTSPGDPPEIRKKINKAIATPVFMLFYNNYQNLHTTMLKFSNKSVSNYNCALTINALKYGGINWHNERRSFCSIAISAIDEDNDFYIINPETNPTEGSIQENIEYFSNVLFTYLHMVAYMKVCTQSEINQYIKSIFTVNEQRVEKLQISKIEYYFNISSDNNDAFHEKIKSKKFESVLDYNKTLINEEISIKNLVQDIVEKHNALASDDNSINDFNEVDANQIFIDRNYVGNLKPRLNTIANELKYDRGFVKIKNPTNAYSLYAYAGNKEYGQICNVHSESYE